MSEARHKAIINKFQSLLRSGKDYGVDYMYEEAGKVAFVCKGSARNIVNNYYRGLVSHEMVDFFGSLSGSNTDNIIAFTYRFNVCEREARLLLRYIKMRR